ncbi:MAG: tetratricopeptide repeat protein [Candidatus Gastranaerophilales bacterium]|nr:tetratricopeptide repeat protein [Candidatus Gastranaerophilales bacterium]
MKILRILAFNLLVLCIASTAFAVDYYAVGQSFYNKGNYTEAGKNFVEALKLNPNNVNCRYYYAQTLMYLKNYDRAKVEYGYVVQLAPNSQAGIYSKQALATFVPSLEEKPSAVSTIDNYVKNAITTSGELVVWNKQNMPLKIYIDNSLKVNNAYVDSAKTALSNWKESSEGNFDYVYTQEKPNADIVITFKGIAPKSQNQILGMTKHKSQNGYITAVQVDLYTQGPNYKPLTPVDVYNVALHEFGHAIGIWGHSDNKSDIMYALYNQTGNPGRLQLSLRDKNTAKAIYEIDKNPYSTSDNSITSVFGNKEDRLNTKLEQGLEYIQTVPYNPVGYINVAKTYIALDNEYEAIGFYQKALTLDPNNADALKALGNIYYKRNDLKNTELMYKALIRIEPTNPHAYCNLANAYIRNNQAYNAQSLVTNLLYRNPKAKEEKCIQEIMSKLNMK